MTLRLLVVILAPIAIVACSGEERASSQAAVDNSTATALPHPPSYEAALPEAMRPMIGKPFKGDLDQLIQRRLIRVAAPFNRTFYYLDGGVARGLSYEYAKLFEKSLNDQLEKGHLYVHVVVLPMPRDVLLSAVSDGLADLAVAQLTITPEREKIVDFTTPTRSGVNEILVTGPGSVVANSPEVLSGKQVFVRKSSSYFRSLEALNARLNAKGLAPVDIQEAPENLEDDDLLEMVNAGLIPATVVDDYLAQFWGKIFPNLVLNEQVSLRSGGELGVAIRKGSPELAASLNSFIDENGLNTTLGAILNKRYLQNADYVKGAAQDAERKKFLSTIGLFRKYGGQYDFDYLLMAAQGYQESRLDQNAKSKVGAIGIMQLLPATGEEQKVGDIRQLDPNIHAGVKYMRTMMDRYYAEEPMDRLNKALFTFASYNAGPGRIRQLRHEAAERGLNPNIWFGNVEQVVAERVGSEPVTYVSNIYKYYVAYKLITHAETARETARLELRSKSPRTR